MFLNETNKDNFKFIFGKNRHSEPKIPDPDPYHR